MERVNVRELIEALEVLPPDLPVLAYDGGTMQDRGSVSGAILGDDESGPAFDEQMNIKRYAAGEYAMINTF